MANVEGTNSSDKLFGQSGNDSINGGSGDDTLYGYKGKDTLLGGVGNDIINGAGLAYNNTTSSQSFGDNEIDTLTGGAGKDTFQLWGGSGRSGINVYYDAAGSSDYALITDFNPAEDIIQLTSKAGASTTMQSVSYLLGASPDGSATNTGLYIDKPGTQADELIAILQNNAQGSLDINASYFSYYG